jgi:predicted  nucleic acid-binding Zn-ribbon protein
MEEEYQRQLRELEGEYDQEKQTKESLEQELTQVRDELENIEERFPHRVGELREAVEHAK